MEETKRPVSGTDYPGTFQESNDFSSNEKAEKMVKKRGQIYFLLETSRDKYANFFRQGQTKEDARNLRLCSGKGRSER